VVAILIFGLGAGVSFYEGVGKLQHPEPMTNPLVNYIVLAASALFEGISWAIALREFNGSRNRLPPHDNVFTAVELSKDPTVFTVLFEDSAALLGLLVAFLAVLASTVWGYIWADGAASLVIGAILAMTAVGLARETKSLLTGEAASPAIVAEIRRIALAAPAVAAINEMKTVHLGPEEVLVTMSLDFEDRSDLARIERTVSGVEAAIKARIPEVRQLFIEVQSREDHEADLRSDVAEGP
jgi:cation diffusion facilitator family transporter